MPHSGIHYHTHTHTHTHTHRLARSALGSESIIAVPGPNTFMEIGHDIFNDIPWVILLFSMIQEGLL